MATPRVLTFTDEDFRRASEEAQREAALQARIRANRTVEGAVSSFGGEGLLPAYTMDQMAKLPPPNWLIDNIVEEKGLTLFYAPDKMGKTAVLSSMLWAWSAGHDQWLHEDFAMRDSSDGTRKVMYVLLEGHATYYSRFQAWTEIYNGSKLHLPGFWTVPEGLALFKPSMQVDDPSTWSDSTTRLARTVQEAQPDILVIDTIARATAGIDENSSQMSQVVAFFDLLRDDLGVATVVVHHTPIGDESRPRGHGSLKGAASSYVRIGKNDGVPRWKNLWHGPHRNAEEAEHPYVFRFASTPESFYIAPVDSMPLDGSRPTGLEAQIYEYLKSVGGEAPQSLIARELESDTSYVGKIVKGSSLMEKTSEYRNSSPVIRVITEDEPTEL